MKEWRWLAREIITDLLIPTAMWSFHYNMAMPEISVKAWPRFVIIKACGGILIRKGNWIIPFRFSYAGSFEESVARVVICR